jgi:hypothetical protein
MVKWLKNYLVPENFKTVLNDALYTHELGKHEQNWSFILWATGVFGKFWNKLITLFKVFEANQQEYERIVMNNAKKINLYSICWFDHKPPI